MVQSRLWKKAFKETYSHVLNAQPKLKINETITVLTTKPDFFLNEALQVVTEKAVKHFSVTQYLLETKSVMTTRLCDIHESYVLQDVYFLKCVF